MRPIFISYRRDDTEGQAGRLFQDLREVFGADNVFMDVATIEPGVDFRRAIEKNTESCGVLLALVGRQWLTVNDDKGRRRLDDPNDFVRLETAAALKRDIPVIPVLLQGARMPRQEDLPEELRDFAFRNSVELTHARWDSDVQLLIEALRKVLAQPGQERPGQEEPAPAPPQIAPPRSGASRPAWMFPAAGAAVIAAALGGWLALRESPAALAPAPPQGTSPSASQSASRVDRPAAGPSAPSSTPVASAEEASGVQEAREAEARRQRQIRAHHDGVCRAGFVWRDARPGDKVCVTPDVRARSATENRAAATTRSPTGGPSGPNTCKQGYVWREAYADDTVCVEPSSRQQAAADNALAARRIVPLPR